MTDNEYIQKRWAEWEAQKEKDREAFAKHLESLDKRPPESPEPEAPKTEPEKKKSRTHFLLDTPVDELPSVKEHFVNMGCFSTLFYIVYRWWLVVFVACFFLAWYQYDFNHAFWRVGMTAIIPCGLLWLFVFLGNLLLGTAQQRLNQDINILEATKKNGNKLPRDVSKARYKRAYDNYIKNKTGRKDDGKSI